MAVFYKKVLRKNPTKASDPGAYHPMLVTMGQKVDIYKVIHLMQKNSALSHGEIENVIIGFVDVMRMMLYNGHAVHIRDFGVFSLSARTTGSPTAEECTTANIQEVRINFRAASNVKPLMGATTRTPGEKIDFVDLEKAKEQDTKPPTPDGEETVDPGA